MKFTDGNPQLGEKNINLHYSSDGNLLLSGNGECISVRACSESDQTLSERRARARAGVVAGGARATGDVLTIRH